MAKNTSAPVGLVRVFPVRRPRVVAVATTTLSPTQRAVRTTVALKALMAVSGLILIGYLLAHMYGNLKVFAGQQSFDDYAHHLRTLGEPILPYEGLLWIIRVVLLAAVLGHGWAAFKLWARARQARGGGQGAGRAFSRTTKGVPPSSTPRSTSR